MLVFLSLVVVGPASVNGNCSGGVDVVPRMYGFVSISLAFTPFARGHSILESSLLLIYLKVESTANLKGHTR